MLWSKAFFGILIGRIATTLIASSMVVSIGWHLYEATGNPFDLALVGLFQIIPIFAFTLPAGWVADHFSRRTILLITATLQLVILIVVAWIMAQPELNKWWLFLALAILGIGRAFFAPAIQSALPNVVPAEQLNRAVALISSSWNFALMIGPFVAGLLIAWIDRDLYWLLIIISLFTLGGFSLLPPLRPKTKRQSVNITDLLGGVAYLRENQVVLGCMTIDLFIVLVGSVMAILPVFVSDVLNAGPETLGLLRAMPAVGATLMGLVITGRKQAIKNNGPLLFVALLIFSGSIVVFATVHIVWVAAVALFIYGASDMVSVVLRSSIVQIATPDKLRGRVSALNTLFIATSNEMGDFRSGSATALLGPVTGAFIGGLMAFGVVGISYFVFKPLRTLGEIKPHEEP
jgi:MFS family permease